MRDVVFPMALFTAIVIALLWLVTHDTPMSVPEDVAAQDDAAMWAATCADLTRRTATSEGYRGTVWRAVFDGHGWACQLHDATNGAPLGVRAD